MKSPKTFQTMLILAMGILMTSCSNPKDDFKKAEQANTEQAFNEFIQKHPSSPLVAQAKARIENNAYEATKSAATVQAYAQFLKRFQTGALVQQAKSELESMEFTQATKAAAVPIWEAFAQKYPLSTNTAIARKQLSQLEYDAAVKANDITAYEGFLARYADSELATDVRERLDKQLEERDWNKALLDNGAEAYLAFSTAHPNSTRIRLLRGTLQGSLAFSLGSGGGLDSPQVALDMDGKSLSAKYEATYGDVMDVQSFINANDAVKYKVMDYTPTTAGAGTISAKRAMPNSVVILVRQTRPGQNSTAWYKIVAIRPGLDLVESDSQSRRSPEGAEATDVAERMFHLAGSTETLLAHLKSPVEMRFYFSNNASNVPPRMRDFARRIEDFLTEYKAIAGNRIVLTKYDPRPDSDAEESAKADGIEPITDENQESYYLGLCVNYGPEKVAIPQLAMNRERALEYDFTRAITRVLSGRKPVVGIITGLPLWGGAGAKKADNPGPGIAESWVFINELKRDFDVRAIESRISKVDDGIDVLLVLQPVELSDSTLYAIDQFLVGGGRLIACLDPLPLSDGNRRDSKQPASIGPSGFDKLLQAWGTRIDTTKVVADMQFAGTSAGGGGQKETLPTVLFVTEEGVDKENIVASQIQNVVLPFAGVFTLSPVSGLKQSVLLHTSRKSELVDSLTARMSPAKLVNQFKSANTIYALALWLEGRFNTAFPDGRPKVRNNEGTEQEKEDRGKPKDALIEPRSDGAVLLIGDVDWLSDEFSVDVKEVNGHKIVVPRNSNLSLIQNAVELMASRLSHAPVERKNQTPLRLRAIPGSFYVNKPRSAEDEEELVRSVRHLLALPIEQGRQELTNSAESEFRAELEKLQRQLEIAQKRLNEMQGHKAPGQKMVLSSEQQKELEEFRTFQSAAKAKLANIRLHLRAKIETLERLKQVRAVDESSSASAGAVKKVR